MHPIQKKIVELAEKQDISSLGFRKIGQMIGVNHPQQIKHHIEQLIKNGRLNPNKTLKLISVPDVAALLNQTFVTIPVYGSANCGPATLLAEDRIEGHIKVSSSLLKKKDVIAIRARGNSMDQATVNGLNIEEGDYVLVDIKNKVPKNGDYVISIIDNAANIKKFKQASKDQVALISESSEDQPTIFISPEDNYLIGGTVTQIIKSA